MDRLLLVGTLAYFLYNYGSMAFGAAYNNMFLVYVALFSASLFGLILSLSSFDLQGLPIAILTLIAFWLTVILFRRFSESVTPLAVRARVACELEPANTLGSEGLQL